MKFLKNTRININLENNKTIEIEYLNNTSLYENNSIYIDLIEEDFRGCQLGEIEIKIENSFFQPTNNLETYHPIKISIPIEELPEKITAFYLYSEWWTRPAFIDDFSQIPERTQVALFKYPDHYACFIPMVGKKFKTYMIPGKNNEITLEMTALVGSIRELKEPIYLISEALTLNEAISNAFNALADLKGILLRDKRRLPEMFDYLGWCSWDAFYKDVDENRIRKKVEEIKEKKIPIRWLIIDDGWMDTEGEYLTDFKPKKDKFPNGFRELTEEIKSETLVNWIGVWHALGGYWSGIKPESSLALKEASHLYTTKNSKLIPSPINGENFYRNWYKFLRNQGIDFVKVDAQSALTRYIENSIPISEAARNMNENLEAGAVIFDNSIINCMGMAMENIVARPTSAISRNSDDFFPNNKESFKEHLLQNAFNALYHDQFFICDWDMFWTDHIHSNKHALLRAISGGPIYISDKIGKTYPKILKSLIYEDGRILKTNRSAAVTEDTAFTDPFVSGVLKLHNIANWGDKKGGGIALFNLTEEAQEYSFSPNNIPDIESSESYWVYNYFDNSNYLIDKDEVISGTLDKDDYTWNIILPKLEFGTPLGLLNKFVGFNAIEEIKSDENRQIIIIKETGPVGWLSEIKPKQVLYNSTDVTDLIESKDNFYFINLPIKPSKMIITIDY